MSASSNALYSVCPQLSYFSTIQYGIWTYLEEFEQHVVEMRRDVDCMDLSGFIVRYNKQMFENSFGKSRFEKISNKVQKRRTIRNWTEMYTTTNYITFGRDR